MYLAGMTAQEAKIGLSATRIRNQKNSYNFTSTQVKYLLHVCPLLRQTKRIAQNSVRRRFVVVAEPFWPRTL